ncbi:MAG: phage tail protein [Novosphingobium sp.]
MKKPGLLRAAIAALYPAYARDPHKLAMWVERGTVRATGGRQRGFAWEYQLIVLAEDFTGKPEGLFFAVVDWLRTQQPDLIQPNTQGFPFEVDVIDDKTFDVKMTLPLREVVTATPVAGVGALPGGWQVEVQPEVELFPDAAEIGPGLTSIWVRSNGDAPVQVAPDPEA